MASCWKSRIRLQGDIEIMNHGIYISEIETGIISPSEGYCGLPVVIGTSAKGPVNEPVLVHKYADAVETFGDSDNWDAHTLSEFIYSQFVLYGQGPAVLIRAAENSPSSVIGGYNTKTGEYTGLELVHHVYHKFGHAPGILLAPGFSHNSEVAAAMTAKAESVSGVFKCICLCDAQGDKYTDIPSWKRNNNITSKRQLLCWPKVRLNDRTYHMSTHLCGVINRTDTLHGDVPYKTPSNESMQIDSCVNDSGKEIYLTLEEANYLNGQGIVTAINWSGGWRAWGNRTAIYPSVTDVKDCFIPVRRMFDFIGGIFINEFWQKADQPITVRLVREIVNSFNLYLNGLTAREMILGGHIEFREDENDYAALIDGKMKFHLYITPPVPAESIEGVLEYDPSNLDVLFDAVRG